jgi:hypothetical protein
MVIKPTTHPLKVIITNMVTGVIIEKYIPARSLKVKKLVLVLLLLLPGVVYAQAIPSSKLAWDQSGVDLATVQAYTYKYYPDLATTGTTLSNVTCSGTTSPFQCEVAYPAFTPGNHTIKISASNIAGETLSDLFAFTFVVQPAKPLNLHIK